MDYLDEDEMVCPDCEGEGKRNAGKCGCSQCICDRCNGLGYIKRSEENEDSPHTAP